jgi:type I restriction enzyme S subunit
MSETAWRNRTLGEVADLCLGKMLDQNKNRGVPTPYLANVNVRWGEFVLNDMRVMRFEEHERDRYGLKYGDIVMCEGGEPGRCAIWKEQVPGMMIQKALHRIRPKAGLDHRFLYYSFRNIGLLRGFDQYFTGATIKHLPGEKLAKVEVRIPPLPDQRRIAGILSAYDDLIENSQRRIKILEEMARRLYREWFVHFRFPGHEGCRLVESSLGEIPEGWEVKPFSAIANYVNGYPFKPAELGPAGKPIVKIKELKAGIVADTPRNTGDNIPGKYHILDGDVLFSWSADLDAYLWMGGDGLLNQHLFTVLPADAFSRAFCFHSLKGSMPRFRALSLGATMHHIKRSALDQVFTVVAPAPMRKRFDVLVEPIHQQLITISKQIQNLRQSRDLLLPRLLSGLIDIESLPEPVLSEP